MILGYWYQILCSRHFVKISSSFLFRLSDLTGRLLWRIISLVIWYSKAKMSDHNEAFLRQINLGFKEASIFVKIPPPLRRAKAKCIWWSNIRCDFIQFEFHIIKSRPVSLLVLYCSNSKQTYQELHSQKLKAEHLSEVMQPLALSVQDCSLLYTRTETYSDLLKKYPA